MLTKRSPIVAVMGHVDHGKTTLIDYIRKTNVAAREAGGITQSIGAYEITHNGENITFIDTPGHEAFSAMRAQGATVADIVILVVAADDSVQPQTKEALAYSITTKTPYVVAINKIDKPNANVKKVKQDLGQAGVFLEGTGGDISYQEISAKTGQGVSELLDLILLVSDVQGLTHDPDAEPSGVVLTCRMDSRRGFIVGAVVKNGTVREGQYVATSTATGKIKMLENFLGKRITSASPSSPVMMVGFDTLPAIGEVFRASQKPIASSPQLRTSARSVQANRENDQENKKIIPVLLKADEVGTLQVLVGLMQKLSADISLHLLDTGIGDIYESDVKRALASDAIIIGFRTGIDRVAATLIKSHHVVSFISPVVYELEKLFRDYAKKRNPVEVRLLSILAIFGVPKGKERVVGGKVIHGPLNIRDVFEVWRNTKPIAHGRVINLQSNRKDITEAETDQEIGMLVECVESIKVGDTLIFTEHDSKET